MGRAQARQRGELAGPAGEKEVGALRGQGKLVAGLCRLAFLLPSDLAGLWVFVKARGRGCAAPPSQLSRAGAGEEGKESLQLQGERGRGGASFL